MKNDVLYDVIPTQEMGGGGIVGGQVRNATCKTSGEINKTFTTSQSYIIPAGYTRVDLFGVGGGGGSSYGDSDMANGGAGGGYTATVKSISVSPGQSLTIVVAAGGTQSNSVAEGGFIYAPSSKVMMNGISLLNAKGGCTLSSINARGGRGGSAGGYGGTRSSSLDDRTGKPGFSDGAGDILSSGQGTTTRAWGVSNGTLYAGGGGGGGWGAYQPGTGGAGGGGAGGKRGAAAVNGTPNTGGGGGGNSGEYGGSSVGGSGIVLIKLY